MTLYDVNGVPIYPGDLLRTYHFFDTVTKRQRYLYHVAVQYGEQLQAVPVRYLDPAVRQAAIDSNRPTGQHVLTPDSAADVEVIHGLCALTPGAEPVYHDERPRGPTRTQRLNALDNSIQ